MSTTAFAGVYCDRLVPLSANRRRHWLTSMAVHGGLQWTTDGSKLRRIRLLAAKTTVAADVASIRDHVSLRSVHSQAEDTSDYARKAVRSASEKVRASLALQSADLGACRSNDYGSRASQFVWPALTQGHAHLSQ